MILAKIIADSISNSGIRITTFELEYPRFIHSEFMTHRQFSRNSASSRAIPVQKVLELILSYPATPEHWGKNIKGMQAKEELDEPNLSKVKYLWHDAKNYVCDVASKMAELGAHKQVVNRITEPFQHIKVVMTTTEIQNFFHLRDHPDAQPEMRMLAQKMKEVYENSTPCLLNYGEWHTPYYEDGFWCKDCRESLDEALIISASCCAQVSYRKLDKSLDKAKEIYQRLIETKPVHASPFEHQATPMEFSKANFSNPISWEKGVTHLDRNGYFWSGNFRGWIQHRQLIQYMCMKETYDENLF